MVGSAHVQEQRLNHWLKSDNQVQQATKGARKYVRAVTELVTIYV